MGSSCSGPRTEQEVAEDTALGTQSLKVRQKKGDEAGQKGSVRRSSRGRGSAWHRGRNGFQEE